MSQLKHILNVQEIRKVGRFVDGLAGLERDFGIRIPINTDIRLEPVDGHYYIDRGADGSLVLAHGIEP